MTSMCELDERFRYVKKLQEQTIQIINKNIYDTNIEYKKIHYVVDLFSLLHFDLLHPSSTLFYHEYTFTKYISNLFVIS